MDYRFKVLNADGTLKHIRTKSQLAIDGDIKILLSPESYADSGIIFMDLISMTFTVLPASLGAVGHDWVELQVKDCNFNFPGSFDLETEEDTGVTWYRVARGEVLHVGDMNNPWPWEIQIVGAKQSRFKKTFMPAFAYPEGDSSEHMRAGVQDVMPQLGGVFTYDEDRFPATSIIVGKRIPNGENLHSFLSAIAAASETGFGASPSGVIWGGYLTNGGPTLDARAPGTSIKFLGMQCESTINAAFWQIPIPPVTYPRRSTFVDVPSNTTIVYQQTYSDFQETEGRVTRKSMPAVTHLSQADPAQKPYSTPARIAYADIKTPVRPVLTSDPTDGTVADEGNMLDGDRTTYGTVGDGGSGGVVRMRWPIVNAIPVALKILYTSDKDYRNDIGSPNFHGLTVQATYRQNTPDGINTNTYIFSLERTSNDPVEYTIQLVPDEEYPYLDYTTLTGTGTPSVNIVLSGGFGLIQVYDVQLEVIPFADLDALARQMYVTPAQTAGEAEISGAFSWPAREADVITPTGETLSGVPVKGVEWVISQTKGYYTTYRFGEVNPKAPGAAALEAVRKQRQAESAAAATSAAKGGTV